MKMNIKLRNIKELRGLSISEMTDEEIVKAAMDRLKSRSAMLVYDDGEKFVFLGRYRKEGRLMIRQLQIAWEEKFGKFKKLDDDNERI